MDTSEYRDNNRGVNPLNVVYYKSATAMDEVADNSVDLIITSPPYYNIKDYAKGHQETRRIRRTARTI